MRRHVPTGALAGAPMLAAPMFAALMFVTGAAVGAEPTAPEAPTDPSAIAALAARVDILTRAATPTEIPEGDPLALDLDLLSVPGAAPDLTRGVTAKAYARRVTVEGRRIGQVVLVGVEKDGRREALDSALFTAQFELETPRLEPAAPVTVRGDRASLIEALGRLAERDGETPEADPVVVGSRDDGAKQAGTNAGANEQAAAYRTPDPAPPAATPAETVRVVTEGCPVRIDVDRMRAIQQSRTVTTRDGAVVAESACTDGADGAPLHRSYSVCSDLVDLEARVATARYLLYCVDAGGARQEVTDCAADPERVFPIVEAFDGCTVRLDHAAGTAVPQSALIYRGSDNADVQVRGCQASGSKPAVPLTRTTDGCAIRHDYAGARSYQRGAWTYTLDGVTYQAGGCADTGVTHAHERVYEGADGQYICAPIVDLEGGAATLQSRLRITVDGVTRDITDCVPDTTGTPIVATTDGCANPATWEHDLAAGVSYGEERFYYLRDGAPAYVTDCRRSTEVFAHQVEIVGYQHHDDQLFAYPLTTVYIAPPTGRHDIETAAVLQGATRMPYELTGTDEVPNGHSEHAGCDALRLTDRVETWTRPDDTLHAKTVGAGAPQGPIDVCVETIVSSVQGRTGSDIRYDGTTCTVTDSEGRTQDYRRIRTFDYYAQINRIRRKNPETGAVVTEVCAFGGDGSWQQWTQDGSYWGCGNHAHMDTLRPLHGYPRQTLFVPPCPDGV